MKLAEQPNQESGPNTELNTQNSQESSLETASEIKPRWYIVHTYSGFEQRVQKTLNEMRRTGQDQGLIKQIIVPTEKIQEPSKQGTESRTTTRKIYPGYIMVQMVMTDFSWHLVQTIPKVTSFIGAKNRPAPMLDKDAAKIISQMELSKDRPRPKFNYEVGDDVRVLEGPFKDFNGVVEEVNHDKGKLKVTVSVFGRQTPVELDFTYVSKS